MYETALAGVTSIPHYRETPLTEMDLGFGRFGSHHVSL
jgi:hypothetical protein